VETTKNKGERKEKPHRPEELDTPIAQYYVYGKFVPILVRGGLTLSVSTLARIVGLEKASPGVKNGGELSKYLSTGLCLACGKWHGTMPSRGMKWATP
jgi:hypothetical protein